MSIPDHASKRDYIGIPKKSGGGSDRQSVNENTIDISNAKNKYEANDIFAEILRQKGITDFNNPDKLLKWILKRTGY